jgi:hypothetical protein
MNLKRIAKLAVLGLTLALAVPALAATGNMSIATFLAKADALKAKGLMALGSSDIGLLRAEGQAAGQAYKLRLEGERKAGNPSSCPPKGTRPSSNQIMAHLRTYPEPARPRTTMKTAIADYFIKTYPCE